MINFKKNKFATAKLILFSILFIFIIGGGLYIGYFLYENFYKTVAYIHEDEISGSGGNIEILDLNKFEEIKNNFEKRKEAGDVDVSIDLY